MVSAPHGRRGQRRARRQLLAEFHPGDACARCGWEMAEGDDLHADHFQVPAIADPDAVPDVLSHARCNVYAGRVLQLAMAGHRVPPHVDEQLELVRRQVLAQVQGYDLAAMAAAAAGRAPQPRTSRDW